MIKIIKVNGKKVQLTKLEQSQKVNILKSALKSKTGGSFSVTRNSGGITIQSLPKNRVGLEVIEWKDKELGIASKWRDCGKGDYTRDADRKILERIFGEDRCYQQGITIDAISAESAIWLLENIDEQDIILEDDKMIFVKGGK